MPGKRDVRAVGVYIISEFFSLSEFSRNVFLLLLFTKLWPQRSCLLENKFSFMQLDMHDVFESINCGPEKGCLNEFTCSNSLSRLLMTSWIHTPMICVALASVL